MSETEDRAERKALRQARQAKRAAREQKGETAPGARKQARLQRRSERAQEVAAKVKPVAGKGGRGAGGKPGQGRRKREDGMQIYLDTMLVVRGNAARRDYPDRLHENCRDGALFPAFAPKFKLDLGQGASVFTIGAGFARVLEPALAARGVALPTAAITIPQADFGRPENPLNEYTARSVAQRLNAVFQDKPIPKATIIPAGQLFSDQLLPGKFNGTMAQIEALRGQIAGIYARLRDCGALVITLSSIESWYDTRSKRFLNRPPPTPIARSRSRHIYFAVEEVSGVVAALSKPLTALGAAGIKVVLAVSPAAQATTFTPDDVVSANEITKATLRLAASRLVRKFDHVDYFPALEIARSAGLHAYLDDNIQLRDEFSALLVEHFIKAYAA
jgi:hypothetical protein